jgi:hypothetical protein
MSEPTPIRDFLRIAMQDICRNEEERALELLKGKAATGGVSGGVEDGHSATFGSSAGDRGNLPSVSR